MEVDSQGIFFFLKMSIFQFFMKNGIYFYNKDREVFFNLLIDDKRNIQVQSIITISNDNDLFLTSYINIKKTFLDTKELVFLSNYTNVISGFFSCYVEEINKEESLFYMKIPIYPGDTCIDENFWKNQIEIHTNNVFILINFLFFDFPKSEFYKNKDLESQRFKQYFINQIKVYTKSLKFIQSLQKEQIIKQESFEGWSKKQLNIEIDKELENFSKGNNKEKVSMRLNLLVKALKKLEKS